VAIRLQFHSVTDGNKLMYQAVSAFVNTAQEYGQHLPEVAATDNPSWDRNWLYDLIPTLRSTQQRPLMFKPHQKMLMMEGSNNCAKS
jgi:hypothetical protein